MQVLEELRHCTHLSELELALSLSDEVRHMLLLYAIHQQYKLLTVICTCSEVGRLNMYRNKGSY